MRKFVPAIAWILISTMLFAVAGCGTNEPQQNPSESGSEVQSGTDGSEIDSVEETESDTGMEPDTDTEPDTNMEPDTGTETDTGTNDVPQGYTITILDKTMWASSNVNVRTLPSTDGTKIGLLDKNQEIKVTGQCNETGWYRVVLNGQTGYVSNKYLTEQKPATPAPEEPNATVDTAKDVTGKAPQKAGSLYVIGNAGFQTYTYTDSKGAQYAELITKVADELKGTSNVYVMPIPLGSGVWLPEEYKDKVSVGDQGAAIDAVLGHMGDNVKTIDIFGSLYEHREEYLYFRTDHHWTQLAAYYAYRDYCASKGITPYELDHFKHKAYDGFVGSFYFSYYKNYGSAVDIFQSAPDVVYTYAPVSDAKMTVTDKDSGSKYTWPIINDVTKYGKGVKYSCFIAGDNPYTIIENKDIKDGSSCLVIKESYGNAFVPWLVDHYQTVHVVDQRYWSGNVIQFAKDNNITDVIFANNLSAIGAQIKNFGKIIE